MSYLRRSPWTSPRAMQSRSRHRAEAASARVRREMADFTILHRNDLERSGRWLLARRSLGLRSFGMNLVEIEPGGSIPEHDELERDQEEIFIVLEGDAILVVDGTEHPAPAGTFVRL